jgi:RNA polymerase sigma factor (TIGR02999 family)
MGEVTRILSAVEHGDPIAAEQLLPLVYDELRKLAAQRLAQEKPGQTLQPTALVHEAYLRLVGGGPPQEFNGRGHFFAAAAESMRRILVEAARGKGRAKRGGDWRRVDFEELDVTTSVSPDQLVALDDALERLAALDPLAGQLVKLRYFAGLALDEAAAALNISTATAYRHWAYARAWLRDAWTTFHTKSWLGETLASQKKYAEAEPLLLAGYEGLKRREADIPLQSRVRLTQALERLVAFYTALGKADEAGHWRKRLEAHKQKGADR